MPVKIREWRELTALEQEIMRPIVEAIFARAAAMRSEPNENT